MSQIASAFLYFNTKDRVGKVVIPLQESRARITVAPTTYFGIFDPEKVYLLIGSLGGFGRSLSLSLQRSITKHGARNFTFVGRSGADKPIARGLVQVPKEAGTSLKVVGCDVSSGKGVTSAVSAGVAGGRRSGGAIQVAADLSAVFSHAKHGRPTLIQSIQGLETYTMRCESSSTRIRNTDRTSSCRRPLSAAQ